ncbi:MAG: response regulator [Aquificales bacterium]|nr:response regulator [Aquificales bacterium]
MRLKVTILLVEDDKSMLDGMRDLLQVVDIGYEATVLTAENGLEALERMEHTTPDLIVSDIMMPKMDGFQFLKTVQQNPEWEHLPFIFLTARGEKHEIHKGRVSGATLYITKPFHSVELLELIKTQLDRKIQLEQTHERRINNLKKDILQILNHEFRTPLTYVTAYYEMLADSVGTYADVENFSEYLRGIQAGCTRLTKLIDGFITVIELRTGELEKTFQQNAHPIANLDEIIQDVIQKTSPKAKQQDIEIQYVAEAGMPILYGDPQSLNTIIEQLLDNAIKFTTPRYTPNHAAKILISTKTDNDELIIVVQDNGMGLPISIQNQIFDPFVQHNRDQLEQQGAGIGLTIAKGLVELHNGRIEVQSVEDLGSTFTVYLPTYTSQQKHQSSNGTDANQATILLVEDDPYLLEGLQELLEIFNGKYKLKVYTALNGRLGLEMLQKHQAHLIISDIMMPQMDGYAFLDEVRKNPDWIQIPFIYLTAKGERRDIHHGLRSGVEEYITKPYNSDELLALVIKQLDRYYSLRRAMSQDFDALKRSILELITPDFRVPLTSVANYSGQLEHSVQEAQTDDELKDSLQGIQKSSIRLSSLVEDFIALAELKTGEAQMSHDLRTREIMNIGLLPYEASQLYANRLADPNIQIHCPLKDNLPVVIGDRDRLMICTRRILEFGLSKTQSVDVGYEVFLDVVQVNSTVQLTHQFPGHLDADSLNNLNQHFVNDNIDDLDIALRIPSLSIIKGYIDLHDGHLLVDNQPDHFRITIVIPTANP